MIEPADKPTVAAIDLDLEQSLKVAYTQRPELVAARLNVDGRQVERKIAENRLLPRFDLVGADRPQRSGRLRHRRRRDSEPDAGRVRRR